jgi:hypothetical protein
VPDDLDSEPALLRAALHHIAQGDWDALTPYLHPYLHWRTADGRALRGRKHVLAELRERPPNGAPASAELRDGQIYRWTS